jgi:hypothetical protein
MTCSVAQPSAAQRHTHQGNQHDFPSTVVHNSLRRHLRNAERPARFDVRKVFGKQQRCRHCAVVVHPRHHDGFSALEQLTYQHEGIHLIRHRQVDVDTRCLNHRGMVEYLFGNQCGLTGSTLVSQRSTLCSQRTSKVLLCSWEVSSARCTHRAPNLAVSVRRPTARFRQ